MGTIEELKQRDKLRSVGFARNVKEKQTNAVKDVQVYYDSDIPDSQEFDAASMKKTKITKEMSSSMATMGRLSRRS